MRVYLAGPLFSEAEQAWLRNFQLELSVHGYDVLWPYELFDQQEVRTWGSETAGKIMEGCRDALLGCDIVVALLDGTQVDDGTAWEIGYACANNIPVVGIRTDMRYGGEVPNGKVNAMIAGSCRVICESRKDAIEWLAREFPGRNAARGRTASYSLL